MPADVTPAAGESGGAIRALTFGSAAADYERYRPGYPPELLDLVLAPTPVRTALEIGAGTGKATRPLAARGIAVTAVEPDPLMREILVRESEGLPVTVVASTLETLPPSVGHGTYDLLYAAAAWHWTDPATRWRRAADLLRPGGTFASFGGPSDIVDPELAAAVSAIRAEVMETDAVPDPSGGTDSRAGGESSGEPGGLRLQWPGNELAESPWFTDVTAHDLATTSTVPADDVVGLLSTVSAYLMLEPAARAEILGRIRGVLPDRVEVRRDLVLHRATRVVDPV